jgi:hypothetical protein
MDIRITDHGNIWVDGKQYIGLDRMNQLLQEKGAIDYDRIRAIVAEAVKPAEITEEQVVEYCKRRNYSIYASELIDERLASQYRLGYNERAKDADERFKVLKAELLKKYKTGIEKWVAQHKDEFCTDTFFLLRAGITVGKMTLEALLKDDPKSSGCDWID